MDSYHGSFSSPFSKRYIFLLIVSVVVDDPFICDQSFPNLCSSLTENGIISTDDKSIQAKQFAVFTRLHSSPELYDFVIEHSQILKSRISSKSFQNKLEAEELRDWTEDLLDLAQQYS